MPGLVALPLAADIAAMPLLAVNPIDIAAGSPLLALWLAPRLTPRLTFAGRAAPLAA